eukprot:gene9292-1672_t
MAYDIDPPASVTTPKDLYCKFCTESTSHKPDNMTARDILLHPWVSKNADSPVVHRQVLAALQMRKMQDEKPLPIPGSNPQKAFQNLKLLLKGLRNGQAGENDDAVYKSLEIKCTLDFDSTGQAAIKIHGVGAGRQSVLQFTKHLSDQMRVLFASQSSDRRNSVADSFSAGT